MSAEQFKIQIEKYTSELIQPYCERLKERPRSQRDFKELNDAIWDTIVLAPFEVLVLDSPLLQRLRRIAQLGVVHWTFGCAVHKRFEHSVGSVQKVQSVIDSLNRHRPEDNLAFPEIPKDITNSLRLAALCHDIGHGFMSHVSENALLSLGGLKSLYGEFREVFDKDKVTLSEAAAYFMVGSPAFKGLLTRIKELEPKHLLVEDYIGFIQNCIVGKPVSDDYPLINELISGPFDCDKLDYMTRDALQSGVPVVTDIKRLAQKVRLVRLTKEAIPREILRNVKVEKQVYFVQGVALSGATTIDELMIGRALLFDKVYRHQKVRTVESMVTNVVSGLLKHTGCNPLTLPIYLCDEDLLDFSKPTLEAKLKITISDNDWKSLSHTEKLAHRLRDRDLFVRCYAFAGRMPQDPYHQDPEQKAGLDQLQRHLDEPDYIVSYKEQIIGEVLHIVKSLKLNGPIAQLSSEHLRSLIALDPPSSPSGASEMARAYLVTAEGRLLGFSEGSAQSSGWTNAYPMTRELGFIFASNEIADLVFLACEAVFRRDLGIRTPKSSLYYAKVHQANIDTLRDELTKSGYYDEFPRDLRALPATLIKPETRIRVDAVVSNLALFEGVVQTGKDKANSIRVTRERLIAFLGQFDGDNEVQTMLHILEKLKVVSREAVVDAVRKFILQFPDFKGAYVCPLGSPRDSSAILTYYVGDLASELEVQVVSVSEALGKGDKPILFADDIIGSGRQSVTIIEQWIDKLADSSLAEDHVQKLTEREQLQLLATPVGFTFACGSSEGLEILLTRCSEIGMNVNGLVVDSNLPKAFDGPIPGIKDLEEVKEKFAEIGASLLTSQVGTRWPKEKVDSRSLGYGNDALLVVFPYNVPTQTLTLLWSPGIYNNADWLPLMPRRKKV